jgi:predicted nucleotidyltransferase
MNSNGTLEDFVTRFPLILPVVKKLNEANLTWMIGGSSCLFLLGNKRVPDDVDIYLLDDEHDAADHLFGIESYIFSSRLESVRNSNPEGEHSIQLTSHLEFNLDRKYKFSITPLVIDKRIEVQFEGNSLYLLSPEDALLVKALLQRGPEVGKKDIEDIQNFMALYQIDRAYLSERIGELGAEKRVGTIFQF